MAGLRISEGIISPPASLLEVDEVSLAHVVLRFGC